MQDATDSRHQQRAAACRACRGSLHWAFHACVMGDTEVQYHQCGRCGSLMLLDPHWLNRSYARKLVPDPDFGALRRTLFIHRLLRRLRALRLVPKHYRSLDYGAGLGMLVRLQRDQGLESWGYDPYATPQFAETFCLQKIPDGTFDVMTCTEVIEHTINPVEVLQDLRGRLAPKGLLVLSTELFEPLRYPDPAKWHYLALEHGQHITLFTSEGLGAAAAAANLTWLTSLPLEGQHRSPDVARFAHLFVQQAYRPPRLRLLRLALRQRRGERRYQKDGRI